jgi:hypothetical protein
LPDRRLIFRYTAIAAPAVLMVVVFCLIIFVPFFGIDPQAAIKSEYISGHSGGIEDNNLVVWNRNLLSGMPQYDVVFWHNFQVPNNPGSPQIFYGFLVILAFSGLFQLLKTAGFKLIDCLAGALIYSLSLPFLSFLPIWVYGWRLAYIFLPWIGFLLHRLKHKGSYAEIGILALLISGTFLLFETELIIYFFLFTLIYMLYCFIDIIDKSSGRYRIANYFLKVSISYLLATALVIASYFPLLRARNQNILDPLVNSDPWRLFIFTIVISLLFFIIRLDKKRIALSFGILLLFILDGYVIINYVPGISEQHRRSVSHEQGNPIESYMQADSTQFRIYPVGKEFTKNRWAINFQTIGGNDNYALARYRAAIDNCLKAEIDKNLNFNWHLLQLLNVKYIVSRVKIPSDRLVYEKYSYYDRLTLYLLSATLPYAWFAEDWQMLEKDEILNQLNKPEFEPGEKVFVEEYLAGFGEEGIFKKAANANVEVVDISSEQIRLKTVNDSTGFLVVSEIYDDQGYWKAYTDSVRTAIHAVDYILRGIVIPPGEHLVEMRYEPDNRGLFDRISYSAKLLILILILAEIISRLWLRLLF